MIGECILGDQEKAIGSIPYDPKTKLNQVYREHRNFQDSYNPRTDYSQDYNESSRFQQHHHHPDLLESRRNPLPRSRVPQRPVDVDETGEFETRNVQIPAGLVGCIIGKGGFFINSMRQTTGAKISISKLTDPLTNQRTFSVTGSHQACDQALEMLYAQMESEKERRVENEFL